MDKTQIKLPYQHHIVYDIPGLKDYSLLAKDIYNRFIQRMCTQGAIGKVSQLLYKRSFYNPHVHSYCITFPVSELESIYHSSEPTISKALKELQHGGYVKRIYAGNQHFFAQFELPKLNKYINK